MSTAMHTPGPWHWEADPVKGDPTGRIRYQIVALGKTITKVYYSSFEGGPTNAEADAKLIATAPDFFEAAQMLLSSESAHMGYRNAKERKAFAMFRTAIKKATGART